jgi:hypothetical protein
VSAASVMSPHPNARKGPCIASPAVFFPGRTSRIISGICVPHGRADPADIPARSLGPRSPHQLNATHVVRGLPLESGVESRNQGLRQPEGEDKLGARHEKLEANTLVQMLVHMERRETYLGDQALEEGRGALLLGHVGQDAEAALRVVKVAVLDARLDDVEGSRHDERGRRTGDGGDEVLEPRSLVVVVEVEEELLGEGGTTKELGIKSACLYPCKSGQKRGHTAKEPGAFLAAVQPQPR